MEWRQPWAIVFERSIYSARLRIGRAIRLPITRAQDGAANRRDDLRETGQVNDATFQSFQISDANQAAFHVCQRVAAFHRVPPYPVVLLGESGVGKTHLLRAIVQRIQATSERGAVAYVTARDFPAPVRTLISNPAPVARASQAVLLVDHLDRFTDRLEELEAVVRIFLDHDHAVVCASAVHPARLHNLPQGLRTILVGGQLLNVGAAQRTGPGNADTAALLREAERLLAESERRQQEWLAAEQEREARLREVFEREQALTALMPDDIADLKARNEQLDAENTQLKRILTRVRFEREMARILMRRAAEQYAAQQHETDAARAELSHADPDSVWGAWEREYDELVAEASRGETSGELTARLDRLTEQATDARARLDRVFQRLRRVRGIENAAREASSETNNDDSEPVDAAAHLGEEFVVGEVHEPDVSDLVLEHDADDATEESRRARNVYFFGPPPSESGMRHVEQYERGFELDEQAKGGEASA